MIYHIFLAGTFGVDSFPVSSIKEVRKVVREAEDSGDSVVAVIRGGTDVTRQI